MNKFGSHRAAGPSDVTGPGGASAAHDRNPNGDHELNDSPEGPFAHYLGFTGDGGMSGQQNVSHRGTKFHWK